MAHTRKNERSLLSQTEMEFVEKARHPMLADLSHGDLHALIQHLRDKRDRAQTIANNQRRAIRGKGRAEIAFDLADAGNREKASMLTDALTRARKEAGRRADKEARDALVSSARRALELKRAAGGPHHPGAGFSANEGMHAKEKTRVDAIGKAGEAGRVTKFVATAQVIKDSRGQD